MISNIQKKKYSDCLIATKVVLKKEFLRNHYVFKLEVVKNLEKHVITKNRIKITY